MRSLALRAARLARPRLMLARAASTGSSVDFPGRAVKVSHVLLPPNTPPSTLDALEARAASGEPFADLAREASKCPSAGAGGSLGWLGGPISPPSNTHLAGLPGCSHCLYSALL